MGGLPKVRHQSVSREEVLQLKRQFSMKVSEHKQRKEGLSVGGRAALSKVPELSGVRTGHGPAQCTRRDPCGD